MWKELFSIAGLIALLIASTTLYGRPACTTESRGVKVGGMLVWGCN